MTVEQLVILQQLLEHSVNAGKIADPPTQEELRALKCFRDRETYGLSQRFELLVKARVLGIEPAGLLALRWLAECWLNENENEAES